MHTKHNYSTLIEVFELLETMLNNENLDEIFYKIYKMLNSSIKFIGNSDPINELVRALKCKKYKNIVHELNLINILLKNNLPICPSRMIELVVYANELHMNCDLGSYGGANLWQQMGESWKTQVSKQGQDFRSKIFQQEQAINKWKETGQEIANYWSSMAPATPALTEDQQSALTDLNKTVNEVLAEIKNNTLDRLISLKQLQPMEQRIALALPYSAAAEALGKIYTPEKLIEIYNKSKTQISKALPSIDQAIKIHYAIIAAKNLNVNDSAIDLAIINSINTINTINTISLATTLVPASASIHPQVSKQKINATQTFTPEKMQQIFTKISEISEILKNH